MTHIGIRLKGFRVLDLGLRIKGLGFVFRVEHVGFRL